MPDPMIPDEMAAWMSDRGWGMHHQEWHAVRQWDTASAPQQAWMEDRGWRRAAHQEGSPGNGLDFLVMHRAMIELLAEEFPDQRELLAGWADVPEDPDDPQDTMPANGQARDFSPDKHTTLGRLRDDLADFPDDEALGLYIETRRRPTIDDPFARSPDATAGIHNYLHNRFSDSGSPVDLGQPAINLGNARFWRLHGWIDARWTAARDVMTSPLSDASLRALVDAEKAHLTGHMHMFGAEVRNIRRAARASLGPVPRSIASPFRETAAATLHRLMSTVEVPSNLDELKEFVRLAVKVEFFTIPLYLTAMWSLGKDSGANQAAYRLVYRIVVQEMLHLGIVCNLLVGLGEKPRLNVAGETGAAPEYPDLVPGLDLADVAVLRPFTRAQIELFLKIERPEKPIPPETISLATPSAPKFATLGLFYDAIIQALQVLRPTLLQDAQIDGSVGGTAIQLTDYAVAIEKLNLVKEQGEGTRQSRGSGSQLAHYYAFEQFTEERLLVSQADGTWKPDAPGTFPFPRAEGIYPMAPIPAGGYPGIDVVDAFDASYTQMADFLTLAWAAGGQPGSDRLGMAIDVMYGLGDLAKTAMATSVDPAHGSGTYGPDFRLFVTAPDDKARPDADARGKAARDASTPGISRVRQILEEAVGRRDIGAHGNFWRTFTREEFLTSRVRGQLLIAVRADGSFDPDESNLVKALEGRLPFGDDQGVAGARFNRMPDALPPVPPARIAEIRAWIAGGCPDDPVRPVPYVIAEGPALTPEQHVAFWRDFDNFFMFQVSPPVRAAIETFFTAANAWFDFVHDPAAEAGWVAALAPADVRDAVALLETWQRDQITRHYGRPAAVNALFDGFQAFGAGQLPADPLRPGDPHRMNGKVMWFFWTACADAILRVAPGNAAIPTDLWNALGRCLLVGLMNDGVVRGRFPVTGFTNGPGVQTTIRNHAAGLADVDLPAAWRQRCRDAAF